MGFPIQGCLQKIRSQHTTGVIPAYWFQGRNQGLSDYHNLYKRWLRNHPIVTPPLQRNELVILSSFVALVLIGSGEDIASGSGWWAKNIITRMIGHAPSFCAFSKPSHCNINKGRSAYGVHLSENKSKYIYIYSTCYFIAFHSVLAPAMNQGRLALDESSAPIEI